MGLGGSQLLTPELAACYMTTANKHTNERGREVRRERGKRKRDRKRKAKMQLRQKCLSLAGNGSREVSSFLLLFLW